MSDPAVEMDVHSSFGVGTSIPALHTVSTFVVYASLNGPPRQSSAYSSKSCLQSSPHAVALSLASAALHINSVVPGVVKSLHSTHSERVKESASRQQTPAIITEVFIFLCSR